MTAILIDFHMFDMLGEISIFAVAALLVLTLVSIGPTRETRVQEKEGSDGAAAADRDRG